MNFMEGSDNMKKIPNKDEAMSAIDILVRYIERIDGDLREGLVDTPRRVIDAFDELMRPLGLKEIARTGVAALARG